MGHTNDRSTKASSLVNPTSLNLQPRPFAPLESDEKEETVSRKSGYSENFLEKIINTPRSESATPVQRKSGNRLKAIAAERNNAALQNQSIQRQESVEEEKSEGEQEEAKEFTMNPEPPPVQRKFENRLRAKNAQKMAIQAKLTIGEPNDKYEQEADATAARVVQQINSPMTSQDQPVQRKFENQLRAKNAQKMAIQAKLAIGEPNDKYEQEADANAAMVVQQINSSTNASTTSQSQPVQRQGMEEDEELQMKPLVQRSENLGGGEASTDLESAIQSARGSGQSLDANLQQSMGQAMGADFSGVKVHTDSQSDQLNKSIQAKAFTTGQDLFFRQGAYEPGSRGGQELIAHELTHVVQQNGDAGSRMLNSGEISKSTLPQLQRMVWTEQEFYRQGGGPKSDRTIDIPALDTITLKKMSQQYQKVGSALKAYHDSLNQILVKKDQHARVADRIVTIEPHLKKIETECNTYLEKHKKKFQTAQSKKSKAEQKKEQVSNKDNEEIKHNEAVEKIVKVQIPEDRKALTDYVQLPSNQLSMFVDGLRLSALIFILTTDGDLSLDKTVLDKDPIPHKDSTGYDKPKINNATFSTEKAIPFTGGNIDPNRSGYYKTANLKATQNDQKRTKAQTIPQESDLFDLGEKVEGGLPTKSYKVKNGLTNAVVATHIDPNNLFMDDGKPHVDEIMQGYIGDCYFLAALGNIVRQDPDLLTQRMRVVGKNVEVIFYRKDPNSGMTIPQKVSVPQTLAQYGSSDLQGARFRVSKNAVYHEWWVEATQEVPLVMTRRRNQDQPSQGEQSSRTNYGIITHREDYYQAALWMPYLEKAYVRFAQKYGQYGTEPTDDQSKGGYAVVNEGGLSKDVYQMFYGVSANSTSEAMSYNLSDSVNDNLTRNQGIIKLLLQAQDDKLTDRGTKQRVSLTSSANRKTHANYAKAAIALYNATINHQTYLKTKLGDTHWPTFSLELNNLKSELDKNNDLDDVNNKQPCTDVANAAMAVVGNKVGWQKDLFAADLQCPREVQVMLEYIVNLVNIGTDSSAGQRNIYSKHAYTISGVTFKDNVGSPLVLSHENLPATDLQKIDVDKSIVRMRNPHRANTPNMTGKAESGNEGNFDITLDQFLRNFGTLDIGTMTRGR